MPEPDHTRVHAWLHRTGKVPVDHPALDRMANVLLDALAVEDGDPTLRLAVVMKVAAMMTAAVISDEESEREVDEFCQNIGLALSDEVLRFRKAFGRDRSAHAQTLRRMTAKRANG